MHFLTKFKSIQSVNEIKSKNYDGTLIIFDWDDTLFPSRWFIDESLSENDKQIKYIDTHISTLLKYFRIFGNIIIVTNASLQWIKKCMSMLPKVKKTIKKYDIQIISARDKYMDATSNYTIWKELTFGAIMSNSKYNNIISIGDSNYEYNALISLNDGVKSLKFFRFLHYDSIYEYYGQMYVLYSSFNNIVYKNNNLNVDINGKMHSISNLYLNRIF